jgi:hypothetical protein
LVLAGALISVVSVAWAAGEWEWTEGQGWVQGAGVSRPTPKEQLAYAYELEQKGEYMDAARQYFLLIQNFPEASESGVGLQRLAKCLFEMENFYTSYQAIEQVIKTYPNTGRMTDLIEIELRIAKKMLLSQASTSIFDDNTNARDTNVRRAIQIVDSVIDHDPYGPAAPEAYLVKGEGHLYIGEINQARSAFDKILDEFSRSDFVERARLGVLRCDSLLGQARPQEVYEQIQVVREMESERERDSGEWDDFDDVEESINQLAEVEAAKMMEQAAQYRRMGTRNALKSADFLYKEVARRYPSTPQAEEARAIAGGIEIPKEESRVAQAVRNIKLNPFTWNRDPEPPWIVPQLKPEDTIMVDMGMGPIAGVPETDFPTEGGASLRPAASQNATMSADLAMNNGSSSGSAGFSPIDAAPPSSSFSPLDGGQYYPPAPGAMDLGPQRTISSPNPLPTISESDLVMPAGTTGAITGTYAGGYDQSQQPPTYPEPSFSQPYAPQSNASLSLGSIQDAPLTDLVGPARVSSSSLPNNTYGGNAYEQQAYAPSYPESAYGGNAASHQGPQYYSAPAYPEPSYTTQAPVYPEPSPYAPGQPMGQQGVMYGNEAPSMGGGWTLDDELVQF